MIDFLKKLMCKNHSVDSNNRETPVCVSCGVKFSKFVVDGNTVRVNPEIKEWHNKNRAIKAAKVFQAINKNKKSETCVFCGPDGHCGREWCPYTKETK